VAKGASAPELKVELMKGRLSDVEGSRYNDTLTGSKSIANFISGGAGNDVLISVRVDALYGGAGFDTFIGATPFKYQDLAVKFTGFTGIPPVPPKTTTTLLGVGNTNAAPTATVAAISRIAADLASPSWFMSPTLN
jgi:Ca2+-binding RTX toxin-like protein